MDLFECFKNVKKVNSRIKHIQRSISPYSPSYLM